MTETRGAALFVSLYTLTAVYCLILTPLSAFYLYQLWKLSSQNIPFFMKRHPKLIIVSGILFNIYPTIFRPFADLTRAYGIYSYHHPFPGIITEIVQWYLLLEYMRLWLLYFDYQHSLNTLSLKWKQQILQQETLIPWTHKYRWLGSVKVLCIISSVCGVTFLVIIEGGIIIYGQSFHNLSQLLPQICTLLMFIIAFKVRKCRDEFMIQKEFKIYGIALVAVMMLYITIAFTIESETTERFILMNMYTCLCCYIMVFVSSHWAIRQYEKQMCPPPPLLVNQVSSTQDIQKKLDKRLTLEEILSTRDGFDLFANHLVREFSIENLFFVFEMVQIKNELITHGLISEEDVGVTIPINFHRVDHLRRQNSHIYSVDEMRTNIAYIVHQYIDMDGEYSVNISFYTRDSLQEEYKKINLQFQSVAAADKEMVKLYIDIFDHSMQEIIDLMRGDSLMRFYQTPEYHNLTGDGEKTDVYE